MSAIVKHESDVFIPVNQTFSNYSVEQNGAKYVSFSVFLKDDSRVEKVPVSAYFLFLNSASFKCSRALSFSLNYFAGFFKFSNIIIIFNIHYITISKVLYVVQM